MSLVKYLLVKFSPLSNWEDNFNSHVFIQNNNPPRFFFFWKTKIKICSSEEHRRWRYAIACPKIRNVTDIIGKAGISYS